MITYIKKDDDKLYFDINNIAELLKISKSKTHRIITKNKIEFLKYKNLRLYDEVSLFEIIEILIKERI